MTTNQIIELEEVCKEYRVKIEEIEQLKKELEEQIDTILPEHIKLSIDATRNVFNERIKNAKDKASELEKTIKKGVLERKETYKTNGITAVYNEGRVSWDDKFLKGLAATVPAVLQGRTEGDPYVSIRMTKME